MKKKILALTLLASLVLTVAACGDDSADTTNSGTTSGQTTTAAPAGTTGSQTPDATTTPDSGTTNPPANTDSTGTNPANPDPTESGTPNPDPTEEPLFSDDEVEYFVVKGHAEIDGQKEEAWNNAQTVTLDIVKKDNPSADTEVKASVMWDEEAIYFLFEITDASIFQGGSVGDYNNDGIYIYIAEDVELYAPDAASYGFGAYQFALINKDLEMLPRRPEGGADLKAQSAYSMTEDGWIIEFCYTFTDYDLAANRFIALDFQYNDCDESSSRLGALSWYNGTDGDFNTLNLAIAKLVEKLPG